MKVEIKIDNSLKEPNIIIYCNEITKETQQIVETLSEKKSTILVGIKDNKMQILEPSNIITIYSLNKKVVAITTTGEYILKNRLYELENILDKNVFIRISNSEIINLKNIMNLDFSLSGTICINLKNGIKTYTSRRYMSKIKKILNI